jgi:hypothetical protein
LKWLIRLPPAIRHWQPSLRQPLAGPQPEAVALVALKQAAEVATGRLRMWWKRWRQWSRCRRGEGIEQLLLWPRTPRRTDENLGPLNLLWSCLLSGVTKALARIRRQASPRIAVPMLDGKSGESRNSAKHLELSRRHGLEGQGPLASLKELGEEVQESGSRRANSRPGGDIPRRW